MAKLNKYKRVANEASVKPQEENNFPKKLHFTSDGNELELIESKKIDGKVMVYYRYVK